MTALFVICVLIVAVSLALLIRGTLLGTRDKEIVLAVAIVALIMGIVFLVLAIKNGALSGDGDAVAQLPAHAQQQSTDIG